MATTFTIDPKCGRCGQAFAKGDLVVPVAEVIGIRPTMVLNPELVGSQWVHMKPCDEGTAADGG